MRLAEVSFEVGNKIGGIHTVLSSKAHLMVNLFDEYFVVGYYDWKKSPIEFSEEEMPEKFRPGAEVVEKLGGTVKYGRWLVPGKPEAILINPGEFMEKKNEIKYKYWEWYGIDSLRSDGWFDRPVLWAYLVGIFLEAIWDGPVIFHEWLSGGALLYLRKHRPEIPTIFHTHATVAGRTLASAGYWLYTMINEGLSKRETLPDEIVYKHWIEDKHLMEKASAHNAHVFTTVSEITAMECEFILGKRPDLVLPNGLDFERIPPIEELSVLHTENEKRIASFVRAYFSPYYEVDTDKMLYFFFSGRYDIRPKGIDILIDALSLLNERLKAENPEKDLVFFFFVARDDYKGNPEVLENISVYTSVIRSIEREAERIKEKIIACVAKGEIPDYVMDEKIKYDLRRMILKLHSKRGTFPPLSTHLVSKDDFIINKLREKGLINRKEDKVKVIYYPAYLSPGDGLLGLSYHDAVTGMHFGVFPSYYEPWGYTPLETAAYGVPSLTSDVSGFGRFIMSHYGSFCRRMGISVVPREKISYERAVMELTDALHWLFTMPRRQRIEKKIEAVYMAKLADWRKTVEKYRSAVELAVHRVMSSSK